MNYLNFPISSIQLTNSFIAAVSHGLGRLHRRVRNPRTTILENDAFFTTIISITDGLRRNDPGSTNH
jgi:hypothetical protein